MSEQTTLSENAAAENSDFKPITSQEELDRIVGARVQRERNKFSDYSELKEKAAKFDAAEEASKSELEKLSSRAEKAEKELNRLKQEAQLTEWRAQVSKDTGVPAEVLSGGTLVELQEHAERLKPLLAKADEDKRRLDAYLPSEGEKPAVALNSDALVEQALAAVGMH